MPGSWGRPWAPGARWCRAALGAAAHAAGSVRGLAGGGLAGAMARSCRWPRPPRSWTGAGHWAAIAAATAAVRAGGAGRDRVWLVLGASSAQCPAVIDAMPGGHGGRQALRAIIPAAP